MATFIFIDLAILTLIFFLARYVYVCVGTACVYTGVFIVAVTVIYTYMVLMWHKRRKSFAFSSKQNGTLSIKERTA